MAAGGKRQNAGRKRKEYQFKMLQARIPVEWHDEAKEVIKDFKTRKKYNKTVIDDNDLMLINASCNTVAKILITTMDICNSKYFIESHMVNEKTGEKYKLIFQKIE